VGVRLQQPFRWRNLSPCTTPFLGMRCEHACAECDRRMSAAAAMLSQTSGGTYVACVGAAVVLGSWLACWWHQVGSVPHTSSGPL
jgi:hypothetical protein